MKAKFYKKFTKKRFGGGSVFLAAHPDEVWQWIEEAVKQARVDELEKILTISNSLGRNLYIAQQIERRIKELNDTDN